MKPDGWRLMWAVIGGCAAVALGACGSGADGVDGGDLEPPPEGQGFQIEERSFTVESGADVTYCERFAAPAEYAGKDIYIVGIDSILPPATHHFFMGHTQDQDLGAGPCFSEGTVRETGEAREHPGSEAKFIFGAGEGRYSTRMPSGYGTLLLAGGFFQTSHHVLNLRAGEVEMGGKFNIMTAPAEEIHHPVRSLACDNRGIDIPPRSTGTVTATCIMPHDLDIISFSSHAHQHLTLFEARFFDGENTGDDPFYTSNDWDSPAVLEFHDEPMHLLEGQGITFTCHFNNDSDEPLTYGAGQDREMCTTINLYAYPEDRPDEVPPPLGTVANDGELCNFAGPDCCERGICTLVNTTSIPGAF